MQTVERPPLADPAGQRHRWPALLAAVVLVAGAAQWWRTHPDRFGPVGNQTGITAEVGQMASASAVLPTGHAVRLRSVEPVVAPGSAAAAIHVQVCNARGNVLGAGRGLITRHCTSLSPIDGQLMLDDESPYVLVTIVPLEPGTVLVEGFDVTYDDGWRHGTERTGQSVEVTTIDA